MSPMMPDEEPLSLMALRQGYQLPRASTFRRSCLSPSTNKDGAEIGLSDTLAQNFTLPHVFLEESQQSYQENKNSWGIPGIPTRKSRNPGEFLAILLGRPGFLVNSWPSYQEDQDS